MIKLAEENVEASLLKKVLNLSALDCRKWSVVAQKLFQSLLNRVELISKTSQKCVSRRKRVSNIGAMGEFDQNMKTHFQFISELEHYFRENGKKTARILEG